MKGSEWSYPIVVLYLIGGVGAIMSLAISLYEGSVLSVMSLFAFIVVLWLAVFIQAIIGSGTE